MLSEQRYDGVRDWEVSLLSRLSTAILACYSQRRAPHGHTLKATSRVLILTTVASEASARLSVCVCVCVCIFAFESPCYCGMFPGGPLEQNGQIPAILFLILARGKVRHVSIHRQKAPEAVLLKTGQISGQMTCTGQQSSFGIGEGEKGSGMLKEI